MYSSTNAETQNGIDWVPFSVAAKRGDFDRKEDESAFQAKQRAIWALIETHAKEIYTCDSNETLLLGGKTN